MTSTWHEPAAAHRQYKARRRSAARRCRRRRWRLHRAGPAPGVGPAARAQAARRQATPPGTSRTPRAATRCSRTTRRWIASTWRCGLTSRPSWQSKNSYIDLCFVIGGEDESRRTHYGFKGCIVVISLVCRIYQLSLSFIITQVHLYHWPRWWHSPKVLQ